MKRRDFLKLLGTATGSTVVASCGVQQGTEKLIPHLIPPEDGLVPGQPKFYSSTCTECPAHCGLSVKVHEKLINDRYGRYPVKLEGLAGHPINDGTLCLRGQSSLTRLYHPERLKDPLVRGANGTLNGTSWEDATTRILEALQDSKERGLRNVYVSGRTTGALADLIETFCGTMGIERLPEFELYSYATVRQANDILYGQREIPFYRIEEADFLLTVGADILETYISPISNAVQFARAKDQNHFRWHHVEPHLSLTGVNATERFVLHPGSEVYLLIFLMNYLKEERLISEGLSDDLLEAIPEVSIEDVSRRTGLGRDQLLTLAQPLQRARNPLVITGGVSARHGSGLEALVLTGLIQWVTGAHRSLVDFSRDENYSRVGTLRDTEALSNDLQQQTIGVMFIARANPVSHLPPAFKDALKRARFRVGLSDFHNETMEACDLILPLSHALESWGDTEPRRDLHTVVRPVVTPLHNTQTEGDVLLQLLQARGTGGIASTYQDYVLSTWTARYGEDGVKEFLERGYHEQPVERAPVRLQDEDLLRFLRTVTLPGAMRKPVLMVTPSVRWFDGRSRELPLLHEIPDPVTTISYGRWVSISEATARKEHVRDGDEVRLSTSTMAVTVPVKIQEGLAEGLYLVHHGMIDSILSQTNETTGEFIAYLPDLQVVKTGARVALPILSGSISLKGKGIIPHPIHGQEHHGPVTLYPEGKYPVYRWAMAIDLDRCIGCSACVAACYIENNIPVVGKKEHLIGREMSWIRIEQHSDAEGRHNFVPMLCQHCTYAPCEPVCPVFAAYHNPEGLNAQIYNRCVGTRYCANNCPYKVRRFNWFDYRWPDPLDKMLNPDVFVRTRGVMEKCTFCVQRIRVAKDRAKDEERTVRDGEVTPACVQTCPTGALVFGNLLDHDARVSEWAHSDRAYKIFEDLGTEPAVRYLSKPSHPRGA